MLGSTVFFLTRDVPPNESHHRLALRKGSLPVFRQCADSRGDDPNQDVLPALLDSRFILLCLFYRIDMLQKLPEKPLFSITAGELYDYPLYLIE